MSKTIDQKIEDEIHKRYGSGDYGIAFYGGAKFVDAIVREDFALQVIAWLEDEVSENASDDFKALCKRLGILLKEGLDE